MISRYTSTVDTVDFDRLTLQLMLTMETHSLGLAAGAVAWLTYSTGLLYSMGSLIYIAMFAP